MAERSYNCPVLTNPLFSAAEFPWTSLRLTTAWIVFASHIAFGQSSSVSGPPSAANTSASPAPSFDVATIKPHPSNGGTMPWMGVRNTPNGIDAAFVTLPMLVQRAYGLRTTDQVAGAPEWAQANRFDIQARMSETEIAEMQKLSAAETTADRQHMLQALLTERFKLKVHSETRQVAVYDLVVARSGSKLKDAATDPSASLEMGKDGKPIAGFIQPTEDKTIVQGESMEALASFLSQPYQSGLGRPVLDKTGLTGTYNFTLDLSPLWRVLPGAASNPVSVEEAGPIFEALHEVGLKLQPSTGPIEMIVIDHAELPTEN